MSAAQTEKPSKNLSGKPQHFCNSSRQSFGDKESQAHPGTYCDRCLGLNHHTTLQTQFRVKKHKGFSRAETYARPPDH